MYVKQLRELALIILVWRSLVGVVHLVKIVHVVGLMHVWSRIRLRAK